MLGAPNLVGGWMILDFGMEKGAFVSPHYQRDCLKLEIPSFIISYFFFTEVKISYFWSEFGVKIR